MPITETAQAGQTWSSARIVASRCGGTGETPGTAQVRAEHNPGGHAN